MERGTIGTTQNKGQGGGGKQTGEIKQAQNQNKNQTRPGGIKKKGPSTEAITEQEREGQGSRGRSGETEEGRREPQRGAPVNWC